MRSTFATILALSLRLDRRERSLSKYHTIYKHIHHASNIHDRIKDRIHHIIILYTINIVYRTIHKIAWTGKRNGPQHEWRRQLSSFTYIHIYIYIKHISTDCYLNNKSHIHTYLIYTSYILYTKPHARQHFL